MEKVKTLKLREATQKHIPEIIELLTALYLELGEEQKSVQFLTNQLLIDVLNSGKTKIYLIKEDRLIIGIVTLTESYAIYSGGPYGSIDEMYIHHAFRGKGIGRWAIGELKHIGRARRWKRIDVTAPTDEKWIQTVKFYESCGFLFTGPKFKLELDGVL